MRILIDGPMAGSYSLAVVNRQFSLALLANGVDVYVTQREGPDPLGDEYFTNCSSLVDRYIPYRNIKSYNFDIHSKNDWPASSEPRCGKRLISHCYAWEETVFPPSTIMELDQFDAIYTTSQFTSDALLHSGYLGDVRTLGNGIDHLQFPSDSKHRRPKSELFTFLHISSGLLRKGIDRGIKAFAAEFAEEPDVRLIIKTLPSETNIIYDALLDLSPAERAKIELIDTELSPKEISTLIQQSDCCFFPSRGEGFLLPAAEAMLHGTLVCTTECGGNAGFCNPGTAIMIPTTLQKSASHISNGLAAWFDYAEADLRHALRRARTINTLERATLTSNARATVANYTWDNVAKKFLNFVRDENESEEPAYAVSQSTNNRFAIVTTYNQRCGIATYSSQIADSLQRSKHGFNIIAESIDSDQLTDVDSTVVSRVWKRDSSLTDDVLNHLSRASNIIQLLIQYHPGLYSWGDLINIVRRSRSIVKHTIVELHSTDGSDVDVRRFAKAAAGHASIIVHNGTDYVKIVEGMGGYKGVYLIPHPTANLSQSGNVRDDAERNSTINLFSFGICKPHKQFEKIIELVRYLKNIGYDASANIVTSIDSTDLQSVVYAHDLWMYRELLDLSDAVTLINDFLPLGEIARIASKSDIAIFPYKDVDEGASGAVRVALGCSLPTIVSSSKIFHDLSGVCLFDDMSDPAKLASAVVKLKNDATSVISRQSTYLQFTSWAKYVRRIERIGLNEEVI